MLLTILLLAHCSSSPPNVRAVSERPEPATASAAAARATGPPPTPDRRT
ncbi:hypothetical protein [Kitasatospora terrestris]